MQMRKLILISSVVLAAVAFDAGAQTQQGYVAKAPGTVGAVQTTKMTATIKAIDKKSRAVTLTGPKGGNVTVFAGPEVTNFDRLKVGNKVEVEYAEALVIELKKGGGLPVGRTESTSVVKAEPGAAPGGLGAREVKVVGDVIATDPATQHITLRGPKRTIDVKVRDPEQFKLIAKGDQIEATYTEAVAVDVHPAAKKPAKKKPAATK
jgi:hypothetical protein